MMLSNLLIGLKTYALAIKTCKPKSFGRYPFGLTLIMPPPYYYDPVWVYIPGMPEFSTTNKSSLFITTVANWIQALGYAKLAVTNGYSGVYGYLGQYFDQAYTEDANGVATTNSAGNTYVASQSAVSAHTYDTNVANYSFYYPPWSLSADTPNIYRNWFAGNNGNGAGRVISFYNTNDFALQRSVWQRDELLKPDLYVLENGIHWDYGYDGEISDPPPWNNFFKQGSSTNATVDFDIVNNLNNRYEVMGYAAQSWTTALGSTPVFRNVAAIADLTKLWPSPDPLGNNYASHFYHSAEFRGDSISEWNYWNTLLFSPILGFNINNP